MDSDASSTTISSGASRDRGDDYVPSSYYRRPQKKGKRVALNFKVPEALKANLELVKRLWALRAEVDGAAPDEIRDIDLTYVCNQLLDSGIDGAWEELGSEVGLSGAPKNEQEWAALQAALEAKRQLKK